MDRGKSAIGDFSLTMKHVAILAYRVILRFLDGLMAKLKVFTENRRGNIYFSSPFLITNYQKLGANKRLRFGNCMIRSGEKK